MVSEQSIKKGSKKRSKLSFSKSKLFFVGKSKYQKRTTKNFWGKKFTGIIVLFLVYNLIIINNLVLGPELVNLITLGDPYVMGIALMGSFLILALLFNNTKFKAFFFGKKAWLKQVLIIPLIIVGNFYLFNYFFEAGVNFLPVLLIMAMFWLIFQSFRLFMGARSFSTKTESRFLKRYSPLLYFFVTLLPIVILGALTVGAWTYRYYLILITLDFIGPFNAKGSLDMYSMIINVILPFLYISLIIIFILIVAEFVITRRSINRRSGTFDNFAFSLIVFFMFIYLLWNITLYLVLNKVTVETIKSVGGGFGGTSYIFIGEFAISMFFLFRAIRKTGQSFGWNILFFNQDSMIMIFLASIFAQTTSRLGVVIDIPSQNLGNLTNIVGMDKLIIPILILLILGITLIIYYLKPQEVSMFMRIAKESDDAQDKSMDIILKFLKQEYIRKGTEFSLNKVESQLLAITNLPKGQIMSIIQKIADKYMDVQLTSKQTLTGKEKFIDFISILEKYESSKTGKDKVKKFMSNQLTSTLSQSKKKISLSKGKITDVKERETFLTALDSGYKKKIKDEKKMESVAYSNELTSTVDKIDPDTKDVIIALIRNIYIERVGMSDVKDPRIQISDISQQIYDATRINPGLLFPLLKDISKSDWNIKVFDLDDNPDTKDDLFIDFFPIDDFDMSNILMRKKPEKLQPLKEMLWTWLLKSTTTEKKYIINTIKSENIKKIKKIKNFNVYLPENYSSDIYYSQLLDYFNKFYIDRKTFPSWAKKYSILLNLIEEIKK
jgi:hypothetical protein